MSQQPPSQSSGQGLLERVFKLREHGTTVRTEAIAGFTTFLTMVYIVFVNPQILGVAGMDTSAVFVTTCLIAAFGSILMGLFANLPVALAPAMGLNAFFAFVVVQAMGLPWQVGMGAIFWGAVGLLLLTLFRVRYWMIANIPVSLRVGITSGIGLFIGMMGLKNAGVIVANQDTLVSIGNLTSHSVLLGVLGFFIIAILASRNIHAAVLVSIVVTTLLGWMLGDVHYTGIVSAPPSVTSVVGQVDLAGSLNLGLAGVIFSFMLVNLFDSSGTLLKQIKEGADCDLFISAAPKQMNAMDGSLIGDAEKNPDGLDLIVTDSRVDLLENKVTLTVPAGNPKGIESFDQLAELLKGGDVMLAIGNSDVPVGQYTLKIFNYYGIDETAVANKLTYGNNVKEVAAQVSEGAVDCGIIYATDAHSAGLTVVDSATAEMCGQVIYPAAVLKGDKEDAAQDFLAYLQTDAAMTVFESVGFSAA